MAVESYASQLERVQGLIAQIEASANAQTTVLGRTAIKHQLSDLYEREKYLRTMTDREAAGGIIVKQAVPL